MKILDFGIAKLLETRGEIDQMTKTGTALGTPRFMSPEQCLDSKNVDQRTDIYSLGVIGYQLLSNKLPFEEDGRMLIYIKQVQEPRGLREIGVEIPEALEQLLLKALALAPEQRFQTMQELRLALAALDVEAQPRPTPAAARPSQPPGAKPARADATPTGSATRIETPGKTPDQVPEDGDTLIDEPRVVERSAELRDQERLLAPVTDYTHQTDCSRPKQANQAPPQEKKR